MILASFRDLWYDSGKITNGCDRMVRVMFICHGNICRSPMAEFILKKMVRERGIENDFLNRFAHKLSELILQRWSVGGIKTTAKLNQQCRTIQCYFKIIIHIVTYLMY